MRCTNDNKLDAKWNAGVAKMKITGVGRKKQKSKIFVNWPTKMHERAWHCSSLKFCDLEARG